MNRPPNASRPGRPGDGNWNHGPEWGHRPGWDHPGWNNPNWGWGGGSWAGHWHNNCIRPHYGWYNGCWNNYWGSNWYAPLAWGAVGWGLGSWTSNWGYSSAYYNPYYVAAPAVPYDYSQPVVVNNYVNNAADAAVAADPNAQPPAEDPAVQHATALFDEGLALFKKGDYRSALNKFDAALTQLPDDPVIHEVRAVTLFALGEYQQSAAALNSFLSSAPGMDWTTMSSLYGNAADYEAQLRKLEQYCVSKPNDAAAYFVLAYQYLVLGAKDQATDALRVVVKNQPKDSTAKRMLDALAPEQATAVAQTPPAPAAAPAPAPAAGAESPTIDLVGNWRAKAGDTTIDLAITDASQFTWKASEKGKATAELNGQLTADADAITLDSATQGAMSGSVATLSPDQWRFALAGAPTSDPGLTFERVR